MGRPVFPERVVISRYTRMYAGYQMGLVATTLFPVVGPPGTTVAAALFLVPNLSLFLRDWLLTTGRMQPDDPRHLGLERTLRRTWGPMLLAARVLSAAGIVALALRGQVSYALLLAVPPLLVGAGDPAGGLRGRGVPDAGAGSRAVATAVGDLRRDAGQPAGRRRCLGAVARGSPAAGARRRRHAPRSAPLGTKVGDPHPDPLPLRGRGQTVSGDSGRDTAHRRSNRSRAANSALPVRPRPRQRERVGVRESARNPAPHVRVPLR